MASASWHYIQLRVDVERGDMNLKAPKVTRMAPKTQDQIDAMAKKMKEKYAELKAKKKVLKQI